MKGHHGVFQGSGRDTGRGIVAAYLSFSRRNPLDGHETRQLFDGDGYPTHARVLLNPRVDEICAQDDHYHRLVAEERERDREYAARLEREDNILAIIVIVGDLLRFGLRACVGAIHRGQTRVLSPDRRRNRSTEVSLCKLGASVRGW